MRIAIIAPYLPERSRERSRYSRLQREIFICKYLKSLKHDCRFYVSSRFEKNTKDKIDEFTIHYPVDNPDLQEPMNHTSEWLISDLKKFQPEYIIIKGCGFLVSFQILIATKGKSRFINIIGGQVNDIFNHFAYAILAENHVQLKTLASKYSVSLTLVLPKYIPNINFAVQPQKKYDICCIGNFDPEKNQIALSKICRKYSIVFVGDGEMFDDVKSTFSEVNHENVYFKGRLSPADTLKVIAQSRIMIHPATQDGYPRVVAEAFSFGLPVIGLSTVLFGVIKHAHDGLLVSECELNKATTMLLEDPSMLEQLSNGALKSNSYNSEEKILMTINSVISKHPIKGSNGIVRLVKLVIAKLVLTIMYLKNNIRRTSR